MVIEMRNACRQLWNTSSATRVGLAVIGATLVLAPVVPSGQQQRIHLNPVIAKLAEGKVVYGLNTGNLSLAYAREVSRAPVDFVYADLEHNPLDFPALQKFLIGMTDRAAIVRQGNLQPNVALFARFPPEANESQWVVKQALDIGLQGVIFNGVDTPEQAMFAVKTMRYPQMRGARYREPNGVRGAAPGNAVWIWGLPVEEYERHADLWPLNPDGDLLATMMIESEEALKNLDKIAAVPGVGALFPGSGNDLSHSLGIPQTSPELEAAFQQILRACLAHKVACAITANSATDVAKRVKEGWNIIRSTVPAITAGRALLGETPVPPPATPLAQQPRLHLNPVIAKLVDGKTVYGLNTGDLSLANARDTARAPVDFVYADLEHNPLDFPALHTFLLGMTDRAQVLKKGNLQPNVALFARFPPEANDSNWVVKQALDMGLSGIIFNGVDTPEQALFAVRTMRYPPMKGAKFREPVGIRGSGPANAMWIWGLSGEEYDRHADVWPLNPDGDLLATMMIESVEGLKNLDKIAAVPGVGALFPGAGGDLSRSLGVRQGDPALETAFQQILKACKTHKVACAITASNANDVAKRVKEGWNIIRAALPVINAGRALLGEQPAPPAPPAVLR